MTEKPRCSSRRLSIMLIAAAAIILAVWVIGSMVLVKGLSVVTDIVLLATLAVGEVYFLHLLRIILGGKRSE